LELICDMSDYMGAKNREEFACEYASCMLNEVQCNYHTIEKEPFAVVFALEKFSTYLLGTKVVAFTNHATLRNLLKKNNLNHD